MYIVIADNNPFNSFELKIFFLITIKAMDYRKKQLVLIKICLKKICEERGDLSLYLMNCRNTSVAGLSYSLA